MTDPIITDFMGQEWTVGDYIVYATSNSHRANLTFGKVLEFKEIMRNEYNYNVSPYTTTEVPTGKFKVKVRPFKDTHKYSRQDFYTGKIRDVYLNNTDNIIKIDTTWADFVEPVDD